MTEKEIIIVCIILKQSRPRKLLSEAKSLWLKCLNEKDMESLDYYQDEYDSMTRVEKKQLLADTASMSEYNARLMRDWGYKP